MTEETLFTEALEIPGAAERAAFLDRACAGDTALRGRVDRLLERHDPAGSFLGTPALVSPDTASLALGADAVGPTGPGEAAGTVIGPYKLLQQIGEGGMGTVFL